LVRPVLHAVGAMVFQARSASRFSDTRVERGVASNNAFYLPFFDATAEYHRSDESSDSCAVPESVRCMRGADIRIETGGDCASGYRGDTRGWDSIFRAFTLQASPQREARGTGSLNAFRSQDGSVLGLGPFVYSPYGEETVERPASNFVTWLASQLGDACSGASRRLHGGAGPEPSGAFCYGCLTGYLPQAGDNGKGDRSQR
jgi:hypothetical protein